VVFEKVITVSLFMRNVMKAAVCYEFNQPLVVEEVEIDPPQAGEVKVKVAACAICHSDIHYAEGAWGGMLPAVYGHEAAGIVEVVGPQVTLTQPGDPVIVSLIRSCGHCYFCTQGDPHLCETKFALDNLLPPRGRK
jgi:Zn-dependent alcohol dehydrogenase